MLKIAVCVKAVPDPELADKVKIDPKTKTLIRADIPMVINPLDKHGLEAALQLKAEVETEISVISMGPPEAGNVVRECMALGADHGHLLSDRAFAGADAFATAKTLAAAVEKFGPFDVVFCGRESSDGATEWVGPELATFLNWPVVTMVKEIVERDQEKWTVKANIDDGYRLVRVTIPAVFTVTRELNTPKSLSFSGILKARKKEINTWDHQALGLSEDEIGLNGSPTIVSELTVVKSQRTCEFIEGELEEKADQLIETLIAKGVLV
jgi:electron transfer flavoprotein beta subunit